ncbi:MAG TPA: polysaccharide deacetylase [Accumulibacter sp.]|nr:polysaccharide deacetylase [Accumulibacter sp.]HNH23527.1 polysaccharide deacetylase [Accumulibacter sp.]HNL13000.1 polysaccharide deacetylase [Accumulibacter sp.]HNO57320.1 polysaccharide deacetylase [Accumulibacter sp.]
MKVYLTFDIEVWCNNWDELDSRFPQSFHRYIYGRSVKGDYALPKTLEILDQYGLKGVFFVEPMFAGRFGVEHLAQITQMIQQAGQDIQLHLHPEWTDEIRPLLFENAKTKRQHLSYYTFEEQCILLEYGRKMFSLVGCPQINAFRAGSFACNSNTYRALQRCGFAVDSSLNAVHPASGLDLRNTLDFYHPQSHLGVSILPLSIFRDGFGKLRPAQLGACSLSELQRALRSALANGVEHFVILSHNFEMLKPGRCDPDPIVVKRFTGLCKFLAAERTLFEVSVLAASPAINKPPTTWQPIEAKLGDTLQRHGEQLLRRLMA